MRHPLFNTSPILLTLLFLSEKSETPFWGEISKTQPPIYIKVEGLGSNYDYIQRKKERQRERQRECVNRGANY